MPVHYYYGEDIYRAEQALRALAHERKATIKWLDREDIKERPLVEWLGQGANLFGTSLPIIRDPATWPAALQATALEVIGQRQHPVFAWERGLPDKRSVLWRAWKGHAEEFSYRPSSQVVTWLIQTAQPQGVTLEPAAAQLLVDRVGRDGYRLLSLLEKMMVTTTRITEDNVIKEVEASPAGNIFVTLDAITRGHKAQAVIQIETLLRAGHGEFYLLSMLAYQVRTLLLIAAAARPGRSPAAIAKAARLHPYVVEKSQAVARRFSVLQLTDLLTRILATDFAIKQGKSDPRTGLLMLVLSLAEQFHARAARAA